MTSPASWSKSSSSIRLRAVNTLPHSELPQPPAHSHTYYTHRHTRAEKTAATAAAAAAEEEKESSRRYGIISVISGRLFPDSRDRRGLPRSAAASCLTPLLLLFTLSSHCFHSSPFLPPPHLYSLNLPDLISLPVLASSLVSPSSSLTFLFFHPLCLSLSRFRSLPPRHLGGKQRGEG